MTMQICLIARNRFHTDRKALVTYRVLSRAGHDVAIVAVDSDPPRNPVVATVPRQSPSRLLRMAYRVLSIDSTRGLQRRLVAAAGEIGADLYIPLHEDMLPVAVKAARRTGGVVQRTPLMPVVDEVDLITLAPRQPELAMPTPSHAVTPTEWRTSYEPETNRYDGETAVLCYRKTQSNPGRYIEAALKRSGLQVRVVTDAIDLGTVDPGTRFVLFVESPYPAIEVTGTTDVPVSFWIHHGEHHLSANLRLVDRYRADAVLLAHSWHLAHWFPTPVHRFPFAVPPELVEPSRRLADRRFDVAMVGSKLHVDAWQYQRRRPLVEALESALPADRVRFVEGVTPDEMAALYSDSRIVLNEGGIRHYPITMRIFEAIGSGAALLTDEPPGLEVIFEPGLEYATLTDDVTAAVATLLSDLDRTQGMCDRALEKARGRHTYDHRIDELIDIAAQTTKREMGPATAVSELARLIDTDVEVQRVVHDDVTALADELPDREVWSVSERNGRLNPASMDAAVITSARPGTEDVLDTARRYIYAAGDVAGIDEYVQTRHPDATGTTRGRFKRIDLMTDSYRARDSAGSSG